MCCVFLYKKKTTRTTCVKTNLICLKPTYTTEAQLYLAVPCAQSLFHVFLYLSHAKIKYCKDVRLPSNLVPVFWLRMSERLVYAKIFFRIELYRTTNFRCKTAILKNSTVRSFFWERNLKEYVKLRLNKNKKLRYESVYFSLFGKYNSLENNRM